jgi:hypothetical protein
VPTMPNWRRRSILAIVVVTLAACDTVTPVSLAPTMSPSIAPTPGQSATPAPSFPDPAPLPTPAAGCSALEDVDLTRLEVDLSSLYPNGDGGFGGFSIGLVHGQLQVTRIEELSGRRMSAVPPPRPVENHEGLMLGGREFVTFPSTFLQGSSGPQSMVEAALTLTLDGAGPIDLPTRFVRGNRNFDQVAVTVPDVAGRGSVTLGFIWVDTCFRYEASGTIPVEVVPLEQTAGCELDEEAYWDDLHALLKGSIAVGTTKPNVGSAFNESKFAPYVNPGIDAWIGYMFDAGAPELTVRSGNTIRIEAQKQRVHLADELMLVIWTRRSIARAVTEYPPKRTVEVFEGRLERQPNGSYELPVPDDPGRYVAAVSVEFESRCSTGTLWTVVNIAAS